MLKDKQHMSIDLEEITITYYIEKIIIIKYIV
jgi:hypothetical protein